MTEYNKFFYNFNEDTLEIEGELIAKEYYTPKPHTFCNFVNKFGGAIIIITMFCAIVASALVNLLVFFGWFALIISGTMVYSISADREWKRQQAFEEEFYKDWDNNFEKAKSDCEKWLDNHPVAAAYAKAHENLTFKEAYLITESLKK